MVAQPSAGQQSDFWRKKTHLIFLVLKKQNVASHPIKANLKMREGCSTVKSAALPCLTCPTDATYPKDVYSIKIM
jgi:hypothetical protein